MDLYLLDNKFQVVAVIDDYESLIWAKRYFEFGDCELYVGATSEYLSIIKKGCYLMRNDDDMICRIKSIELDTDAEEGNHLIIVGHDCRSILSQRVIWFQTNVRKITVEKYIRKLVSENVVDPTIDERKVDNFTLGDEVGLTDEIKEQQVTYKPLDEKIIELCKAYGYGTRVSFNDDNEFVFEVYKGLDRSYNQDENDHVVFSSEFDNIISSKYISDDTGLRNVALVAGEGEGSERKRYSYGKAEGLNRYELFVDANDLSSNVEEGETIDYTEAMKARAIEALAEYGTVESFEGEVEPNYSYKYGTDYNLGDIVQVKNDYGVEASARITEVIETFDNNGYSVVPTFQYQEVAE